MRQKGIGFVRDRVLKNGREDSRINKCQRNEGTGRAVARGVSLPFHQFVQEVQWVPDELGNFVSPKALNNAFDITNLSKDGFAS